MKERLSLASLEELDPALRPWAQALVAYLEPYGVVVTSVYRSPTTQLALWLNRANNPYPVAPPGRSYHEYRRAWDMTGPPDVLAWAGAVWKSWGGRWGGDLQPKPDDIHFEA